MPDTFDPYLAWLGIRDRIRPPNHYRLLGLEVFESDLDVIATAADRQMAHVRTFQAGTHSGDSQRLLNELAAARVCLLKPEAKAEYDRQLRAKALASSAAPPAAAMPQRAPTGRPVAMAPLRAAAPTAVVDEFEMRGPVAPSPRRRRRSTSGGRLAGATVSMVGLAAILVVVWKSGMFTSQANSTSPSGTPPAARTAISNDPPAHATKPSASNPDQAGTPVKTRPPRTTGSPPAPVPEDNGGDSTEPIPAEKVSPAQEDDPPSIGLEPATPAEVGWPAGSPDDMPDDMPMPIAQQAVQLPIAPAAEEDRRIEVPAGDAVKSAVQKVKELFAAEMADDPKPEAQAALTRSLLDRLAQIGDDPAGEFALLKVAEERAVAAFDSALLGEVVAARAKRFRVDAMVDMVEGLNRLVKAARMPAALQGAMETADALLEQSIEAERFDRATELARIYGSAARKSKIKAAAGAAAALEKRVRDLQKAFDRANQARSQLANKPDDRAAHLQLGKYLAFSRGDWEQGLPHLASGSDDALVELASRDLAQPADARSAVALADAWWQAGSENAAWRDGAQFRGRVLYERALPELTGLEKARVEKRLASREGRGRRSANRSVQVPLGKDGGGRDIKLTLVLISPGRFNMGSPPTETGALAKETVHPVTLSKPYFLATTEMTKAQWFAVMGNTPSGTQAANLPMNNINWHDCGQFCQRLNAQLSGTPWGSKLRFRLPTEAEWEFACRAGGSSPFSFGDNPLQLVEFGWSRLNSQARLHPVSQLRPNAWGLYDMHGNVAEWCADVFDTYPAQAIDPVGPAGGALRVQRGGSGWDEPAFCRSARRGAATAVEVREAVGFRVAADSLDGG